MKMANIVEITDHMINIVEDYAEIMGVEVNITVEIQDDRPMFTVEFIKEST